MLLLGANSTGTHGGELAEAVDFDGTNDYLSRSSDLTGNADGKTFTFSAWVWIDGSGTTQDIYVSGGSGAVRFRVQWVSTNNFRVLAYNAAGTNILNALIAGTEMNNGAITRTHYHILISIDLANTSNRGAYINDIAASATWATYTNDTVDFTNTAHSVAASTTPDQRIKGRLTHVFLAYEYVDLSIESNRRIFITSDRKPA